GNALGLIFQRQVSLGDNADAASFAIHNGDAADLMLLHKALAVLHILAVAAAHRIRGHELLDSGFARVEAVGDYRAAQVAVSDHADETARIVIGHHRHRADVLLA